MCKIEHTTLWFKLTKKTVPIREWRRGQYYFCFEIRAELKEWSGFTNSLKIPFYGARESEFLKL